MFPCGRRDGSHPPLPEGGPRRPTIETVRFGTDLLGLPIHPEESSISMGMRLPILFAGHGRATQASARSGRVIKNA
jgi:hypothetical protein